MSDLVTFLLARIAEDEADARAASRYPTDRWFAMRGSGNVQDDVLDVVAVGPYGQSLAPRHDHIARWNPARTLAECQAKRAIIARQSAVWENAENAVLSVREDAAQWELEQVLQLLAQPYAGHPDYRPEWTPAT